MKTTHWAVVAVGLMIVVFPARAIVLSVTPGAQTANLGEDVSVDITIDGLGDGVAPSLGTFDINLGFDSGLLGPSNVQFGDQLDVLGLGSIQSFSFSTGSINLFELSLDPVSDLDALQLPSFTLATVTFATRFVGTSVLTLETNALGDALGNPLEATILNGSVGIESSVIPEPNSALLLLIGLAVLAATAAYRHRFRASAGAGLYLYPDYRSRTTASKLLPSSLAPGKS